LEDEVAKKYPCDLSIIEKGRGFVMCEHGGTKRYNYGFTSGTACYCRLDKKWVCDLKECPIDSRIDKTIDKEDVWKV
jgi:hypothetical protein